MGVGSLDVNDLTTVLPGDLRPVIDLDEIARIMGANGRRLRGSILHEVTRSITHVKKMMAPQCEAVIVPVENCKRGLVVLAQGAELASRKLAKALRDAQYAVCFIVTLGEEVDAAIKKHTLAGNVFSGYIMDAIGSAAAENLAEQFHMETVKRLNGIGKGGTHRFSPGYCDWPITEQGTLFSVLGEKHAGVSLHNSSLMIPRKSVSAVFGIIEDVSSGIDPFERYNPCRNCGKKDCVSRR